MTICRSVLVSLVLVLFATTVPAQYSERVDVLVANVDVVVTDRSGKPVRGLGKDDFEIRENGSLQAITNFAAFDGSAADGATGASGDVEARDAPPARSVSPRLIALFVDIGDMEPYRRQRFFSDIGNFLDGALRDGDVLTVLSWNHRVHTLLAPTADRRRMELVLDGLSEPHGKREVEISRKLAALAVAEAERDAALSSAFGSGIMTDPEAEREFQQWLLGEERCQAIKRKAKELRNTLSSMARVEMQKVVIFASDDLSLQPAPGCATRLEIERLALTANAYGMTIHALHPPGARDTFVGPDQGGALPRADAPSPVASGYARAHEEAGGLMLLAERTGGLSGHGLESARVLGRVAQGLESYYSLGYRMSSGIDDEPRKIEVTTKNRKYRVRARQSVVRPSEASQIRDLVVSTLYLPEPAGEQTPSFEVRVTKGRRDGQFVVAGVEVSIRASDLVFLPSERGLEGSYSLFVSGGRVLGDASDVVEIEQKLASPESIEDERRVTHSFSTRMRPDTRRLSIAVRDNVSGNVAVKLITLSGM